MENQHKSRKTFLGNLAYGLLVGLTLLVGAYTTLVNNSNLYLKAKDFEKARWIEYDNKSGRIWSCYAKEEIPKHTCNWNLYIDKVREKNNGKLEGEILLPDLDGDGVVGK